MKFDNKKFNKYFYFHIIFLINISSIMGCFHYNEKRQLNHYEGKIIQKIIKKSNNPNYEDDYYAILAPVHKPYDKNVKVRINKNTYFNYPIGTVIVVNTKDYHIDKSDVLSTCDIHIGWIMLIAFLSTGYLIISLINKID